MNPYGIGMEMKGANDFRHGKQEKMQGKVDYNMGMMNQQQGMNESTTKRYDGNAKWKLRTRSTRYDDGTTASKPWTATDEYGHE